jgi:hypothetical protein
MMALDVVAEILSGRRPSKSVAEKLRGDAAVLGGSNEFLDSFRIDFDEPCC